MKKAISYNDWIRNESEIILQLINNKKLLEEQQENEYFYYATNFVKKIKTELYGANLILKILSKQIFIDRNKKEMVRIESVVMELTAMGYIECEHPLDPEVDWIVSAVIPRSKIDVLPENDELFYAKYSIERKTEHLKNLIKVDLGTLIEINESFIEKLTRIGGTQLVKVAEEVFTSDFEKNLVEKLLILDKPLQEKIGEKQTKLEEDISVLEQGKKAYNERFQELTEEKKQWLEILTKIDLYMEIEGKKEKDEREDRTEHPWIQEKSVDMLQSLIYHNSEDDLIYDERVVETFLRAIQTNTMVILSGPSGTGKSSIVMEFANAIKGAKATLVPVQSGWTDTQDLLGYFNPIDQCFVPTPFMEALANASNDLNHIHLICLDEMNLAHVEYYFSEFLSSREKKSPSIRLYSERYFTIAKSRLKQEYYDPESEKIINAVDLIHRYPPDFKIPTNVRFIGTMNMDHTVKSISPKVIDRSFLIEIDHLNKERKNEVRTKVAEQEYKGCLDVPLHKINEVYKDENAFEKEVQEIIDLSHQLESIANAPLNSRGRKQILSYLDRVPNEELKGTVKNKYFDQIIYSKILPRIEISKKNEEGMQALKEFQEIISPYEYSYEKLEKMLADERFVHFW